MMVTLTDGKSFDGTRQKPVDYPQSLQINNPGFVLWDLECLCECNAIHPTDINYLRVFDITNKPRSNVEYYPQ